MEQILSKWSLSTKGATQDKYLAGRTFQAVIAKVQFSIYKYSKDIIDLYKELKDTYKIAIDKIADKYNLDTDQKVEEWLHRPCSEKFILQDLFELLSAEKVPKQARIICKILSERKPCVGCFMLMEIMQQIFPNIKYEINYYHETNTDVARLHSISFEQLKQDYKNGKID